MKIAILGTGVVGQTLSEKLVALGHEIYMGTRNVEETHAKDKPDMFGRPPVSEWIHHIKQVNLVTFAEAAKNGYMIINATSGQGALEALTLAGKENIHGKVVMDISNPLDYSKGMPPTLSVCNTDSLGEQIQKAFPDVKVVKTLNTMSAYIMVNPALIPGDHNVFMSGNDAEAKAKVKELLKTFGWKEENITDIGDITTCKGTEMLLPIWVRLMGTFQSPMFNFKIVRQVT